MIGNMHRVGNKVLSYSVLQLFEKGEPPKQIRYKDNDLVTQGEPLKRKFLYGNLLRVPQNSFAVVVMPGGDVEDFSPGEHIVRFETNYLDVQFVDKRDQSTAVKVEKASSFDGWEIRVAGHVNWRVQDAAKVVSKRNPHRDVQTAAMNAVRSVVAGLVHDKLTRVPGKSPMKDRNLAETIRFCLSKDKNCEGIEIISFTFDYRTGNERRTEIAEETLLKEAEAKLEQEKIERELALAGLREELVLRRAETDLKEAQERDKIRLQEAANTARADKLLEPVQERQLMLKLRAEEPERNLRREEIQLNAKAKAIEPLANVVSNLRSMSGIRNNMGGMGVERFGEAIQIIAQSMAHDHYALPHPAMNIPKSQPDMKSLLLAEIEEVMALESVGEPLLRPCGESYWLVELTVSGTQLQLSYDLSDNNLRLFDIVTVTADGVEVPCADTTWTEGLTLVEIVSELTGPNGRP